MKGWLVAMAMAGAAGGATGGAAAAAREQRISAAITQAFESPQDRATAQKVWLMIDEIATGCVGLNTLIPFFVAFVAMFLWPMFCEDHQLSGWIVVSGLPVVILLPFVLGSLADEALIRDRTQRELEKLRLTLPEGFEERVRKILRENG